MPRPRLTCLAAWPALLAGLVLGGTAIAQTAAPPGAPPGAAPPQAQSAAPPQGQAAGRHLSPRLGLEPRAMEILKGMCDRLTAARSLSFDAIATVESPARTGHPLAYATRFEVLMQRPDKLRVVMPGDGPPSEFTYDGRRMVAFAPEQGLVAVAAAPPTIDAMLKAAFDQAAIYFPFSDLIVSDPCKDMTEGLAAAFVVGQSRVIGDTTTDVLALANRAVQVQIWIGAQDRLPRAMRATFFDDPAVYRHSLTFMNWRVDPAVPADAFAAGNAANANPMPFARPDAPTRAPQR